MTADCGYPADGELYAVCIVVYFLQLIQVSIAEACRPQLVDQPAEPLEALEQQQASQSEETNAIAPSSEEAEMDLCDQISRCFAFFIGVLNAHEFHLQSLLYEFYGGADRKSADEQKTSRRQQSRAMDFRHAHGVKSVADVAKLFPGNVHPSRFLQLDDAMADLTPDFLIFSCLIKRSARVSVYVGAKSASAADSRSEYVAGFAETPAGTRGGRDERDLPFVYRHHHGSKNPYAPQESTAAT